MTYLYPTISKEDVEGQVVPAVVGQYVGVYRGSNPNAIIPKLVMSMASHASPPNAIADAEKQTHFKAPGGELVAYLIVDDTTDHKYRT